MTTTKRHHTITGLELIVPVDTDINTDGSPSGLEERSASGNPIADNNARPDVCAEAEAADEADHAEAVDEAHHAEAPELPAEPVGRFSWTRILAYGVLPGLALLLALGVGYLKWQDGSARLSQQAAAKSVQVARESTIAMLSYRPDTAEKDLTAASDRLTGTFRDDYTKLIADLVIPGAKQKQVSAVATVPAAASVSATENHAVVLVCVDQTTIIGNDPPANSASSVRITLDKVRDRWLISRFDPV
jgi:Mce-associated membrane protein